MTETLFTQNYRMINETIGRLSRLGVKLSIDDFGTGYSSLSQLCQFNIHNLKIDRSFIAGVDKDINKGKIVKAVISLANSLNVGLIAEGVETREQLNFLRENECTTVQGYLFSRPVGIEKIEKMLVKHEGD
ncbi:MAG: EAL domain-containing protein [Tissierellia bacterium]|nr:EAL domain-containing protein [Tissierellia bacterium]